MEKLIELLNEYDSGWAYDDYYGLFQYGQDRDAYRLCKYQLVSKEYGFIKWLVDNDKIDKEFEDKNFLGDIFDSGYRYNNSFIEDRLLCYLALTDEPIEFLISVLK